MTDIILADRYGNSLTEAIAAKRRVRLTIDTTELALVSWPMTTEEVGAAWLELLREGTGAFVSIVAKMRSTVRRNKIPEAMRHSVFERDSFACVYCGSGDDLECDHVLPVARGGSDEIWNLATACRPCNASKSDKLLDEWGSRNG